MSNRIGRLVKDIQYLTDFTIDQVAGKIGYTRPHLNRLMKSGDSKKVYSLLQEKFSKELQNVQNTPVVSLQTNGGPKTTKTSKDTQSDKLTSSTRTPQFEMKQTNGNGKDQVTVLMQSNSQLIDTNKNQQETIGKLTDLVTKLVEKR